MKRRDFVTGLAGGVVWPVVARAQPVLPVIGFFGSSTLTSQTAWVAAFTRRLRELGWIERRNITIVYRWAEGRPERFAAIAAEFVQMKVDVIYAMSTDAALAAKQATSRHPDCLPDLRRPDRYGSRSLARTT